MSKVFYFFIFSLLLFSFGANLFADNFTATPDKYLDKSIKERNRYITTEGTESIILWDNRNVQSTSGLVAVELTGLPADSQLVNPADDFVVPAGMQWTVDSICRRI